MKVQFYPADLGGCAHFRCIFPAQAAEAEGLIEWDCSMDVPAEHQVGNGVHRVKPLPLDVDVIVWQRPIPSRQTVELIEGYAAQGVANIVDIDDDLSCLHPAHPGRLVLVGEHDHRWLHEISRAADLITVSTPALAERYGGHGRVAVLRNRVPDSMLGLPSQSDGRTVGWAGLVATHPGDLPVTHGGVAQAIIDEDWRFHVVGLEDRVQQELGLAYVPSSTGSLGLEDWHRALGKLDIGIVPLADTKFNHAKSALKGLEYAARGIPFVASPTPEYQRLAAGGAGLLAPPRGRNWRSQLLALMRDDSLRSELADQGKRLIEDEHLYVGNGWRWVEAWETALALHKRPVAA